MFDTWVAARSGWVLAFGAFVAVLAGALALQLIGGAVLARVSTRWHPMAKSLFKRTKAVAHFAFFMLAVAIAVPLAPLTPRATDIAQKILTAGFIALVGWVAIVASHIAAERYVARFQLTSPDSLLARKAITQVRILSRTADALLVVLTIGFALMSFESVRQYGVSLFASAGVVGIIVGIAAQPTLGNLFAGVQLALTQPIRLGDSVVVEGEFGEIEEINSTYIVVKLWDWRRLVVPLTYFLQKPIENWSRTSSSIIGSVFFYVDYSVPVETMRVKLKEIAKTCRSWDGQVADLHVTASKETSMELRATVSAATAQRAWELKNEVREKLLAFLLASYPNALPRRNNPPAAAPAAQDHPDQRPPEPKGFSG
jgi:small-conductance mechanosensitive channel